MSTAVAKQYQIPATIPTLGNHEIIGRERSVDSYSKNEWKSKRSVDVIGGANESWKR
jgi:hypothetical protein